MGLIQEFYSYKYCQFFEGICYPNIWCKLILILRSSLSAWKPGPGDKAMYDGQDMPSADLAEEYAGSEPQALPPDVSKLPSIPGYENVGYHGNGQYDAKNIDFLL